MSVPYSNTIAQVLDKHLRIRHSNSWQYVEDVRIRHNNTWEDVKEVYIRHSGSWQLVHEGEHFLFKHDLNTNSTGNFDLALWISNFYGKEMQSRTRWKPITNVGVEDFFTNNKRFVDGKVLELEEYLEAKQEGRV